MLNFEMTKGLSDRLLLLSSDFIQLVVGQIERVSCGALDDYSSCFWRRPPIFDRCRPGRVVQGELQLRKVFERCLLAPYNAFRPFSRLDVRILEFEANRLACARIMIFVGEGVTIRQSVLLRIPYYAIFPVFKGYCVSFVRCVGRNLPARPVGRL